ncbi:transposase-like zinc-binding domain-containing protein [Francisella sp. TX07-6608]|uniref:IS1/IS1595 family N-terminal zinc-binding domain-containing protein n=1 Tax=Francisella sp. TX07-6608 TaxID=573568 RepID=UPI003B63CFA1
MDACKKKTKSCPNCGSKFTQKYGRKNDIQRYKCNSCNKAFSSNRRPKKLLEVLFYKYVFNHQTYADLSIEYGKSNRWVYTQIRSYKLPNKKHKPRAVTLFCDTTFYGKRKDKLATVFFYDAIEGEVLLWRHVDSENLNITKIC